MARKGIKPAKRISALRIFIDATFSWKCSTLLWRNGYEAMAYSLEAFSLELHLKCLHHLRGREPAQYKHCIANSFNGLDRADKQTIRTELKKLIARAPDLQDSERHGYKFDIPTILKRAENLFVEARYSYEGGLKNKWRLRRGVDEGISPLIRVIHDLILRIRPRWKSRVDKAIQKLTPST